MARVKASCRPASRSARPRSAALRASAQNPADSTAKSRTVNTANVHRARRRAASSLRTGLRDPGQHHLAHRAGDQPDPVHQPLAVAGLHFRHRPVVILPFLHGPTVHCISANFLETSLSSPASTCGTAPADSPGAAEVARDSTPGVVVGGQVLPVAAQQVAAVLDKLVSKKFAEMQWTVGPRRNGRITTGRWRK